MYERRSNAQIKKRDVPFRGLNLAISDHDAPDGTLRVLEDLRWAGPPRAPFLTPVPPPASWFDASVLTGVVVAIGKQFRNSRGLWSDQSDSSLERHIIVTSSKVYLLDEANAFRQTEVYDFGSDDPTRKAVMAQVGEVVLLAISASGAPEFLLQLRDDACFAFNPPALPDVAAAALLTTDDDGLQQGVYAYRYAYELLDGSVTGASEARIIVCPNALNQVQFFVLDDAVDDNWRKLIRRLVIYMTQASDVTTPTDQSHLPGLMDSPFFEVTSLAPAQAAVVTFSDTNDAILSKPRLDDTNLAAHRLAASALFAYNKRLLLGDVSIDFVSPLGVGMGKTGVTREFSSIILGPWERSLLVEPQFIFGSGTILYWYVTHVTAGHIQTLDVDLDDFTWKIEGHNGVIWVTETTGANFSNVAQDYTRMRVVVQENGAVPIGQTRQLTINTQSDLGFNAVPFTMNLAVVSSF